MVHTMESPPFDLQAYQPPSSLWKLIEQYVPSHEIEEIKNMLGESMIDQSLELHEEVNTLLDIWRDYREESATVQPVKKLAEPPGVRDRLIQEIQFIVENVTDKAKNEGINADKILARHNADVLDYAMDTLNFRADSVCPSSRQTAHGMDGRETPMICSPTCSDRTSEASILSEEVDAMNDKLNIHKVDEVFNHLRSTLEEEIETLMRDIRFLQDCLDDEATFRAESTGALTREPTLTDLREERSSLQKDLNNMSMHSTPPGKKQAFVPAPLNRSLGPSIAAGGKVKSSPGQGNKLLPIKPAPLKALATPDSKGRVGSAGSMRTMKGNAHDSRVGGSNVHEPMGAHSNVNDRQYSGHGHQDHSSQRSSSLRNKTVDSAKRLHRNNNESSRTLADGHGDISGMSSDSRQQPTLEAVVTLSKGKTSDATEMHVIPSPPSSAKPSTVRPGSAQRFRSMVMGCRDST